MLARPLLLPNEFAPLNPSTNPLSLDDSLTKLCTSKPIETYTSFSGFKGQTTMEFWRNPHHKLSAVSLDSNWLRHKLSAGLQISNYISYYLTNTFKRCFWCGG